MNYLTHIPTFLRPWRRDLRFTIPNQQQAIYLTFDDGPTPKITPWVLHTLQQYQAKATFFLIGNQINQHPELVEQIINEGHAVGHHSQHHPNGWNTPLEEYVKDVRQAASKLDSRLFRPPYGRITRSQSQVLKKDFELILWSDLSGDFDAKLSDEQCIRNATSRVKPGSIVVFHDNDKCADRLKKILVPCLEHYKAKGWDMEAIPQSIPAD